MKHLLFLLFMAGSVEVLGQGFLVTDDKPFVVDRTKDSAVYGPLSRSKDWEGLNSSEKEYLYWVNYMRVNPARFQTTYVQPFLLQFPEAVAPESRSLETALRAIPQLPPLVPLGALNTAAADHAVYLANKGALSHTGRGGKSFQKRMEEAGIASCAGEVIFQGKNDALIALILLLMDHNVPGLGHRKALLAPVYTRTGVAVRPGPDGRYVFVQDLACD